MAARYCDGDGWHQTNGLCVSIEGGLVRHYYRADDRTMKIIKLEKPCKLNAFKVRLYRAKHKSQKVGE